jgi:glutathione S-transferase
MRFVPTDVQFRCPFACQDECDSSLPTYNFVVPSLARTNAIRPYGYDPVMITFYHNPNSPLSRRVWITLLEKGLDFESVILDLNGDQFQSEFLSINPLHHIPVLVDSDRRILESLAIMDYLDAQYPEPALMPRDPWAIGKVRMAQMLANNELSSIVIKFCAFGPEDQTWQDAETKVHKVFHLFEELLGDGDYLGGDRLSLGDIVVVNGLYLLDALGVKLGAFPTLKALVDRIMERPIWRQTQPDSTEIDRFKRKVKVLFKLKTHRLSQANQKRQ